MSPVKIRFAITGKMGSGKSTVAKIISEISNAKVLHIAGKLKVIIRELELPNKREILQDTGDFFRQWDKLVWIKVVLKEANKTRDVVIDDVRYNIERDELIKNDFLIIRVFADNEKRRTRIAKRDNILISDEKWDKWAQHPTEQEINQIVVAHEIDNNGYYEDLVKKIKLILSNNHN